MKLARFPALQWVGRAGITQLALAAVDVALWDLRAKHAGRAALAAPRRRHLADGSRPTTPTSAGCRSRPTSSSRQPPRRRGRRLPPAQAQGRLARPRHRPRPDRDGAAGGRRRGRPSPSTATASGTCRPACASARGAEPLDVFWFEEPLWYDDVAGHAALARARRSRRPRRAALHRRRLQRLHGGGRGALRPARRHPARRHQRVHHVAEAAQSRRLPVVPHVGDMGRSMSTWRSRIRRRRCSNTSPGSWTASSSPFASRTDALSGRSFPARGRRQRRRRWRDLPLRSHERAGPPQARIPECAARRYSE